MLSVPAPDTRPVPGGAFRPLRIGVLASKKRGFDNWQLRVFDRIISDPRFELAGFLVATSEKSEKASQSPLLSLASRLERVALARQPAFIPAHFDPDRQRFEDVDLGADGEAGKRLVQSVEEMDLDLVISLLPQGLPDTAVRLLPLGEWHLSFTAETSGAADWYGYASVIGARPSTPLRIEVRRGDPLRTVCLATSSFNTKFSAVRNADFVKERAVTLLMRELGRSLDERGPEIPAETNAEVAPEPQPRDRDLLAYGLQLSSALLGRAGKALKSRMGGGSAVWTLYAGRGTIDDFDPRQAIEIEPDDDEIRADPFLLEHEGECYLFYEAYAQGQNRAHIAVSRFVGDRLERLGIALQSEHHLSYPFVFRHDGDVFMMPETNQARRIEVWRCVEFPLKWELYSTALEGQSAADSSLTWIDGKWWLFTNLSDFHAYEDHCSELHVFEVDGPALKRIVPHRRNPVVIDSTLARNAGRMFERNGKLYRPSQRNEYGVYGYGLNIMEIDQLDLDNYRERCIRTIVPDFKPGLYGCHHFDAAGGRYIIDARRDR